jgi:hypothetical protein
MRMIGLPNQSGVAYHTAPALFGETFNNYRLKAKVVGIF